MKPLPATLKKKEREALERQPLAKAQAKQLYTLMDQHRVNQQSQQLDQIELNWHVA